MTDKPHDQNIRQKYGIAQEAEISPQNEETEEQEYVSDGLPSSTRYSVDKKTGRPVILNSKYIPKNGRNNSGSGQSA